jgi:hypothetical protein
MKTHEMLDDFNSAFPGGICEGKRRLRSEWENGRMGEWNIHMSGVAPLASRASTNTLGHSKRARACSTVPIEQARARGVRPFADGMGVLRTYRDSSGRATRALRMATRSGVHGRGCSILVRTRLALGIGISGRSGLTLCQQEHRRGRCDGTLSHRGY